MGPTTLQKILWHRAQPRPALHGRSGSSHDLLLMCTNGDGHGRIRLRHGLFRHQQWLRGRPIAGLTPPCTPVLSGWQTRRRGMVSTTVRAETVMRWLADESQRLEQDHVAVRLREERVRHLVGLLLASGATGDDVNRLLPPGLPAAFLRSLPRTAVPQEKGARRMSAYRQRTSSADGPPRSVLQRQILAVLRQVADEGIEELSRGEIALRLTAAHGMTANKESTRKALYRLVERGLVVRTRDGGYGLDATAAHDTGAALP